MSGFTARRQKQDSLQGKPSESSEKQATDANMVDRENGPVLEQTSGVRREETEVDIPPGERLSIAVACHAKWVIFKQHFCTRSTSDVANF